MQPELAQTEALIQGIAAARNHVIEGWMPLAQGFQQPGTPQLFPQLAPNAAKFAAQQAAYLEQQARLWSALLEGKPEALAKPDAGDRRFSGREWSENRYYNYLRQSNDLYLAEGF